MLQVVVVDETNFVGLWCSSTTYAYHVQHSRTKHIDIRYHFLRDHIDQGDIELVYVPPPMLNLHIYLQNP